jgi:Pyruvate/2-oxoacid:ferredoxin oxidoreductase delta subunit
MTAPPAVVGAACANAHHAGAGCTRCADVCPVAAIDLPAGGAPVIDAGTCVGCAACVPVCVLEAIGDGRSARELVRAVADLPPGPVVVVCDRRRDDAVSVGGHVVAHGACLASLDAGDLLVAAAERAGGAVVLDDTACSSCDIGGLADRMAATVSEANGLEQGYGRSPSVHLASETVRPTTDGPWHDRRHGAVSRRGLLRRLGTSLPDPPHVTSPSPGARRLRLLALLDAWAAAGSTPAAVEGASAAPAVVVDADRCDACSLCARLCPTGALSFAELDGGDGSQRFELRVRPALCVGCSVCVAACRAGAVALSPTSGLPVTRTDAVDVLVTGALSRCEACESPVRAGTSRCFSCGEAVVTADRDEAGLMADLLARIPVSPP